MFVSKKELTSMHRPQGGHTNTERGYLPVLAEKLRTEFSGQDYDDQDVRDIEVLISQEDRHPLHFV